MQPDVSVLIVNYNVKRFLASCITSIQRSVQSMIGSAAQFTVEIVVVDNASSDGSVEELRPLFLDVVWVPLSENIGFGKGNNVGMKHCTGKFLLYLNPDTIVAEDTIPTMIAYMNDHPEVGMAGCKVLNADGTFQVACRRGFPSPWVSFCKLFGLQSLFPASPLFARYNMLYKDVDETYDVDGLIGAFMLGRTSILKEIGGFDERFFMYAEDLDLCHMVKKRGYHIRYVHTTTAIHYKGESTRRSDIREVYEFYMAMQLFARKHFGSSTAYLAFLRIGIAIRSSIAHVLKLVIPDKPRTEKNRTKKVGLIATPEHIHAITAYLDSEGYVAAETMTVQEAQTNVLADIPWSDFDTVVIEQGIASNRAVVDMMMAQARIKPVEFLLF